MQCHHISSYVISFFNPVPQPFQSPTSVPPITLVALPFSPQSSKSSSFVLGLRENLVNFLFAPFDLTVVPLVVVVGADVAGQSV